jgi:hypothetical protein
MNVPSDKNLQASHEGGAGLCGCTPADLRKRIRAGRVAPPEKHQKLSPSRLSALGNIFSPMGQTLVSVQQQLG